MLNALIRHCRDNRNRYKSRADWISAFAQLTGTNPVTSLPANGPDFDQSTPDLASLPIPSIEPTRPSATRPRVERPPGRMRPVPKHRDGRSESLLHLMQEPSRYRSLAECHHPSRLGSFRSQRPPLQATPQLSPTRYPTGAHHDSKPQSHPPRAQPPIEHPLLSGFL